MLTNEQSDRVGRLDATDPAAKLIKTALLLAMDTNSYSPLLTPEVQAAVRDAAKNAKQAQQNDPESEGLLDLIAKGQEPRTVKLDDLIWVMELAQKATLANSQPPAESEPDRKWL
ncbi:hypothetical protein [Dyella sp. 2HG41-7]|uniref:hypothetical protein n=1 Tax=Dyella sp. 2HG41-7 TaxID=2883239 RepID=UPI001F2D6DF3|nr:hypothetical protein [Dyella sp. 2HG41-7]